MQTRTSSTPHLQCDQYRESMQTGIVQGSCSYDSQLAAGLNRATSVFPKLTAGLARFCSTRDAHLTLNINYSTNIYRNHLILIWYYLLKFLFQSVLLRLRTNSICAFRTVKYQAGCRCLSAHFATYSRRQNRKYKEVNGRSYCSISLIC